MKYIIITETGSVYEIDTDKKTWERIETTDESGYVRSKGGTYNSITNLVIGERLNMLCPPIVPNMTARLISTSPIVFIKEYSE
jgi:hypothetical protein